MDKILEKLASSGRLTQEQVNRVSSRANALMDELEKTGMSPSAAAANPAALSALKEGIMRYMVAPMVTVGALTGVSEGINYFRDKHREKKMDEDRAAGFEGMLQARPDLAKAYDPTTLQRAYSTLHRFSPVHASDPVVAATFVENVAATPGLRVDINQVNSLAQARKNLADSASDRATPAGVMKAWQGAQSMTGNIAAGLQPPSESEEAKARMDEALGKMKFHKEMTGAIRGAQGGSERNIYKGIYREGKGT